MEIPYAHLPLAGEEVFLRVNVFGGTASFKPEFISLDGILDEMYRQEHGDDDIYHGYDDDRRFCSVRIFKTAEGEVVALGEGERWRGRVDDWRISGRKSKDGRVIIYVNVRDLQRVYSWDTERTSEGLVVSLKCGDRVLRRRVIPLAERLYRFREEGDPTKTITEIKALGTPQRPVALTDVRFPRRTTLRELVDAELAVFDRKMRSAALQKAAAQNILRTIRVVSPETISRYWKLPLAGRR